jgi:hypothetical protein
MQKQTKSFNLTLRNTKAYSIILSGFQFATSLFFRIGFKIAIALSPSFIQKAVSAIRLRRVNFAVSKTSLIANITQTISARRIRIVASMKQTMKFVSSIYLRNRLSFVSRTIQKLTSSIIIKKIQIASDPTIAQFFLLGTYDPDTLGDWDAVTLGAMDYVEV